MYDSTVWQSALLLFGPAGFSLIALEFVLDHQFDSLSMSLSSSRSQTVLVQRTNWTDGGMVDRKTCDAQPRFALTFIHPFWKAAKS